MSGEKTPLPRGGGDVRVRLSHVTLVFDGDVTALDDVSLEVHAGERICVLGANGSGKSTLASVICGLLAPDAGSVELVGERVCSDGEADLEAYRRARRKLGLVFQNPDDQIVTSVVEDDVAFGPENLGVPRAQIRERVDRELHRVALDDYAKADPSRLSGGQKQRVAIAGALAMEPKVLVLDEPSSLLDVRGREAILRVMGRLSAAGTTLVHVTHYMDEALEADRVIVLDHGRVALEGTPAEVFGAGAPRLRELGLEAPFAASLSARLEKRGLPVRWTCDENDLAGQLADLSPTCAPARPTAPRVTGEELVRVEHASFSYGANSQTRRTGRLNALENVSLSVSAGSSVAIVGQTGSGKSTLLRLICGLEVPDSGSVTVCKDTTSTKRGRRAVRSHVGYVMQHPERQLFAETVEKDVGFGPHNLGLDAAEVSRRVREALDLVGLDVPLDTSPFSLSGGQQRLCALAGILAMEPTVLVLDEPTAGLDPKGRKMLRTVLTRLLDEGVTLIQVTHSMEDAARTDRVVVLDQSHVVIEGAPADVFSAENAERLAAIGLGIPRSTRFARRLETEGVGPIGEPLTSDALADALAGRSPEEGRDQEDDHNPIVTEGARSSWRCK